MFSIYQSITLCKGKMQLYHSNLLSDIITETYKNLLSFYGKTVA